MTNPQNRSDVGKSYEQAIQQLEEIVNQLERGELSLDDSLKAFEEGINLSRYCFRRLEEASKRVQQLIEAPDGNIKLLEFNIENIQSNGKAAS